MKQLIYTGLLSLHNYGEAEDVLFLSELKKPLADVLEGNIAKKTVTVRYWITDEKCSPIEAKKEFLKRLAGCANCQFFSHYSEITGYLWVEEDIMIGGHDLLAELKSHVGKWLILEIDVHKKNK